MKISFFPDSDREDRRKDIEKALKEYKNIWETEGDTITEAIEKISGLEFQESFINAVVYKSHSLSSRSVPLSLNSNLPKEQKKWTLVHELCHRLISGNKLKIKWQKNESFEFASHKYFNLIFYDILVELYGEKAANKNIEYESRSRRGGLKKAWEWALCFDKEERAVKFKRLIENSLKN